MQMIMIKKGFDDKKEVSYDRNISHGMPDK